MSDDEKNSRNESEGSPQERADRAERDRVIASTGWGVKPDDQPSNASEVGDADGRVFFYDAERYAGDSDLVRRILQAQRRCCNLANRVSVSADEVIIFDLNGDGFNIKGLGYGCEHLIPLLQTVGAAFDPRQLRKVKSSDPDLREYEIHRAWAWGEERPAG